MYYGTPLENLFVTAIQSQFLVTGKILKSQTGCATLVVYSFTKRSEKAK